MFYRKYGKRALDILLSGCAILVLSPVLLIVAILVRTKLGSPVLFHQERPGRNEKIFTLCKFRTMTDERDENGQLLPDSVRLTSFGKFLRSRKNYCNVWRYLYRRDFLLENQLFSKEGFKSEDLDYSTRVLLSVKRCGFYHNPYYCYRVRRSNHEVIRDIKIFRGVFEKILLFKTEIRK